MGREPARSRARSTNSRKGPGAAQPPGPLSRSRAGKGAKAAKSLRPASFDWRTMDTPMAGVDEAGRGCLAGPVVAAAVILPEVYDLDGLTDSKQLSEVQRETLEPRIKALAVAWGVGVVWPSVIDEINILQATFTAMHRALTLLKVAPASVVIDGDKTIPSYLGALPPQRSLVDGDVHAPAVSAASVLAKTFRDRIMIKLDKRYPGYHFASNKGYGAKAHLQALREIGPCRMHRLTFRGVLPEKNVEKELWLPGI